VCQTAKEEFESLKEFEQIQERRKSQRVFCKIKKKSEINIFKTKNTIDDGWEDISEVDIFFSDERRSTR